jgi:hypothetical protein
MFFWREIQISEEIIFTTMSFKNIKDDYSGNLPKFQKSTEKYKLRGFCRYIFALPIS